MHDRQEFTNQLLTPTFHWNKENVLSHINKLNFVTPWKCFLSLEVVNPVQFLAKPLSMFFELPEVVWRNLKIIFVTALLTNYSFFWLQSYSRKAVYCKEAFRTKCRTISQISWIETWYMWQDMYHGQCG